MLTLHLYTYMQLPEVLSTLAMLTYASRPVTYPYPYPYPQFYLQP